MADVQKQFEQFNENIRLRKYSDNETLREKRDIVLDKLSAGLKRVSEERGVPLPKYRTFNQGSYLLGTGIKPLDGDYDIDVGIRFQIGTEEEPEPVVVKEWVYEALEGHTNKVEIRRPCVTVFYQSGDEPLYHVDLAVYSDSSANSDGFDYLAKGKQSSLPETRVWERADPDGLVGIIESKHSGRDWDQFRRCIRYLKRWKDLKFSVEGNSAPVGIGITLAAYYWFNPVCSVVDRFSGKTSPNDLEALHELVTLICRNFNKVFHDGEWAERLVVALPVVPGTDTFDRMSNAQMDAFRKKVDTLNGALAKAREEVDPVEACTILRGVFGADFPVPDRDETGAKRAPAIIASSHSG